MSAGKEEIPITPEMVTAGVMAIRYSAGIMPNEAVVARVFRAMIAAFPHGERSWGAVFAAAPVIEWEGDV